MKQCRICGGAGIIYNRTIEAGSHGDLAVCQCVLKKCTCGGVSPYQVFDEHGLHAWCPCRSARTKLSAAKKAFHDSQIPKKYLWKFYEDFNTNKFDNESDKSVSNKLVGLASTIRATPPDEKWTKGFYFWGTPGSGKTLLACIILQELMLKYALPGRFVDISRQFFQRLKRSYDSTDELYGTEGQILDELIEVPFLVIDDFGVQRNTEWESEMLYNLIDARYEKEFLTIITSNMHIDNFVNVAPNELAKVAHGRIHSRIKEMCSIYKVDLPDYRENFKKEINFVD
jgi:DNA replication protein DnaC